jgi:phytoene/squalene synthetase
MLLSCTAAVIGALWFIAGPYFMKRWKAITIICIISNIFTITGYTTNYDHDTAATDDFYYCVLHWSFIILALVLSCNTLDYLDAILNTFPHLLDISKMDQEKYQNPYTTTYWIALFRLVFIVVNEKSLKKLNASPIDDLQTAIKILGPASRSWKTMAALFPVNLRQDLCLLYAFFRTADDLVDDAATPEQGERNLLIIRMFLQDVFSPSSSTTTTAAAIKLEEQVTQDKTLPPHIDWNQYAALLPYNSDVLAIFRNFARISHYLCPRAMSELTNAWEHDLEGRPATKEQDLLNYAAQISGTFGELCTCVIMYKTGRGNWGTSSYNDPEATKVLSRARSTGQVNYYIIPLK